jgi:hypothetical protein
MFGITAKGRRTDAVNRGRAGSWSTEGLAAQKTRDPPNLTGSHPEHKIDQFIFVEARLPLISDHMPIQTP